MNQSPDLSTVSGAHRPPSDEDVLRIVVDLERQWARTVRAEPSTMSTALYDPRALFFGSKDELFIGESGIARYFREIPPGFVIDASFSDRAVSRLSDDVIISGSYVTFRLSRPEGPVDSRFRITFTLVRTADGWKIAQHHASPRVIG